MLSRLGDERALPAWVNLIVVLSQQQPSDLVHTIAIPYLPERAGARVANHERPFPVMTADDAVSVEQDEHLREGEYTPCRLSRPSLQGFP